MPTGAEGLMVRATAHFIEVGRTVCAQLSCSDGTYIECPDLVNHAQAVQRVKWLARSLELKVDFPQYLVRTPATDRRMRDGLVGLDTSVATRAEVERQAELDRAHAEREQRRRRNEELRSENNAAFDRVLAAQAGRA